MHRLNLATSTIVHLLRNYTPTSAAACASSVVTPCIQHCCDLFWFEKWLSESLNLSERWSISCCCLLLSASIAVEETHINRPQNGSKDSKGMNQQAQSNYKANYKLLQGDDLSVHWVPIAPSKANFKTLSQISQQSQPQATTPVGDVACSFWSSDQRHRGFKPTSNIFELVALKHLDGESWRINVRPN